MIVNYPMLTSTTISPGIIPGICKLVERYILVHEVDSITDSIQQKITRAFVFTGHAFTIAAAALAAKQYLKTKFGESEDFLEFNNNSFLNEDRYEQNTTFGKKAGYKDPSSSNVPERPEKVRATKFDITLPNVDSISLEPTWVKVDAGDMGTKVVGVKVIPFPIKTNGDLSSILLNKGKSSGIKSSMKSLQTKAIKLFFAFSRGIKMPFIKDKFLTGDVKKDVIWASSKYGTKIFTLLNLSEISSDGFFKDMGGFPQLQKSGMGSVIMADDINRRAIFCMKEFKGSCSVLPYQYIYAGLGKSGREYTRIYDDIEDVRKSASPFFKLKGNRKKFMGESFGMKKLEEYRNCCKGK